MWTQKLGMWHISFNPVLLKIPKYVHTCAHKYGDKIQPEMSSSTHLHLVLRQSLSLNLELISFSRKVGLGALGSQRLPSSTLQQWGYRLLLSCLAVSVFWVRHHHSLHGSSFRVHFVLDSVYRTSTQSVFANAVVDEITLKNYISF